MFEMFANIRRSIHASTSTMTPWMDNGDLLAEYEAKIAMNQKIIELGACGATAKEAYREIRHYRNLRAKLLAG